MGYQHTAPRLNAHNTVWHVLFSCSLLTCDPAFAQAKDPEGDLTIMAASAAALVAAAFLRPVLRTISFVSLGAVIFFSYFQVCSCTE
jgi:hypothetical protein